MTETGQEIINEYRNIVKEQVEDDKGFIRLDQCGNIIAGTWRLMLFFIHSFFTNVVVVITFYLYFMDASTLGYIRMATNEEIISKIDIIFNMVLMIQVAVMLVYAGVFYRRYYHNIKRDRIDFEAKEDKLRVLIVEFSEEVLARHKLIEKGIFDEK